MHVQPADRCDRSVPEEVADPLVAILVSDLGLALDG